MGLFSDRVDPIYGSACYWSPIPSKEHPCVDMLSRLSPTVRAYLCPAQSWMRRCRRPCETSCRIALLPIKYGNRHLEGYRQTGEFFAYCRDLSKIGFYKILLSFNTLFILRTAVALASKSCFSCSSSSMGTTLSHPFLLMMTGTPILISSCPNSPSRYTDAVNNRF